MGLVVEFTKIKIDRKIEQAYLVKEIGTNAPMLSNFEHY